MDVPETTACSHNEVDENESGVMKKHHEQTQLTEDEEAFQGPKFYPPVYRRRYAAVCELAKKHHSKKVLDFGCAEAKLVKVLINQESLTQLEEVVGVDIDRELLESNKFRIRPLTSDYLRPRNHPLKVSLYQGSVAEPDERFVDFDLISCIELIEHLEDDILHLMPQVIFGQLSPKIAIITTPNVEFNVLFPNFQGFRHHDHKFEWTRAQFQEWADIQARKYNYSVTFDGIGPGPEGTEHLGCCSQVAVFERISISSVVSTLQHPYSLVEEVEYPFRVDTRTEEDKVLQEVEYILWLLSFTKEDNDDIEEKVSDNFTLTNEDDYTEEEDEALNCCIKDDCTSGAEDDQVHVYSLEKLMSFPSLCKLCCDIQRLREILQDSSLFQLSEDGLGVLWQRPSHCWSSDGSETNWDDCGNDWVSQDSELNKFENWDDDPGSGGVCDTYDLNSVNAENELTKQLCWNNSEDSCKLWNGKDWCEIDDEETEERVEDDFCGNFHYCDNRVVLQESEGSLSGDSDDDITDGLFWISPTKNDDEDEHLKAKKNT